MCHNAKAYLPARVYSVLWTWDVSCNVVLVLYVNYKTDFQPETFVLTLIAVFSWIVNNTLLDRAAVVHAMFVQWPLCVALLLF